MFLRFALILGFTHVVFSDKCTDLCADVADCKDSEQGSYCKESGECFGLFYEDKSVTTMCYFPRDEGCSQDSPVLCPAEPVPDAQA